MDIFLITIYTTAIFKTKAMMMLSRLYSARNDSRVVNDPAPAMKGNTTGIIVKTQASIYNKTQERLYSRW